MVSTKEFDKRVRAAIRSDDVVALRDATSEFALWKRAYVRTLVIDEAWQCMQAFVDSHHVTLRHLPYDVATHSASTGLMLAAVALPEAKHVPRADLVAIIEDRVNLTAREREDMCRAVMGMVYVN